MPRFVTVDIHTSPWDAHITKGRLESEGIPVFIAHEHHIAMNWMYSNALGGVKLQVAAENAALAREALIAIRSGACREALSRQFPEMEANVCPQCGSEAFTSRFSSGTIVLIFFLFFACDGIFPARRDRHTCLKCSQEWSY